MSLDLFINSSTPVRHRGTGVYIRENGTTRELQTKQEVLTYFPDADPENIVERTYEDDEYFHINLTHNLTDMADECNTEYKGKKTTLYNLLWHPEELGVTTPDMQYVKALLNCYTQLRQDPDKFKQFNPSNGWGTYEQLVAATRRYIIALMDISGDFDNYTIKSDT